MPDTTTVSTPASKFRTVPGLPSKRDIPGLVRLVKDALRVGRFVIGFDDAGNAKYRNFTANDLDALARRHSELTAAGLTTKLCWNHPRESPFPPAEDCIADVAECWAVNGTLYFSVYVTPAFATKLQGQFWPCSIGTIFDFVDGTGKLWEGECLAHVACVSQPAVPDQSPFLEMGLKRPAKRKALTAKPKSPVRKPVKLALPFGARADGLPLRINPGDNSPETARVVEAQRKRSFKTGIVTKLDAADAESEDYAMLLKLAQRLAMLADPEGRDIPEWTPAEFLDGFEGYVKAWEKAARSAKSDKSVQLSVKRRRSARGAIVKRIGAIQVKPGLTLAARGEARRLMGARHRKPLMMSLTEPEGGNAEFSFDRLQDLFARALAAITGEETGWGWLPAEFLPLVSLTVEALENPGSVGASDDGAAGAYPHIATLREPSIDWTINHGPGSNLSMSAQTRARKRGLQVTAADREAARRLRGLPSK